MSEEKQENMKGESDGATVGRPSKFKEEYPVQAEMLCEKGFTDVDLADFFGVTEKTIDNWKNEYPLFLQSIKKGKEVSDSKVVESLYHRACGYSHPDIHITQYEGDVTITPLIKHYPPDPTAMIFWLKNRRKNEWRDRHELTGPDGGAIPLTIVHFGKVKLDDTVQSISE